MAPWGRTGWGGSIDGSDVVAVIAVAIAIAGWLVRRRRWRAAPDEAVIVYGRRSRNDLGFRVVVGGGTLVLPVIEQAVRFPLNAVHLAVRIRGARSRERGVLVNVDCSATVRVPVTPDERAAGFPSVRLATTNFLRLDEDEIRESLTRVLASHLRALVASVSPSQLSGNPTPLSEALLNRSAPDLAKLGYAVLTLAVDAPTVAREYEPEPSSTVPGSPPPQELAAPIELDLTELEGDEAATDPEADIPTLAREQLLDALRSYAEAGLPAETVRVDLAYLMRGVAFDPAGDPAASDANSHAADIEQHADAP